MPQFSYKDIIKRLKKAGFVFHRQAGGSHEFWINPTSKQKILVAKHNKNMATGTVTKIANKQDSKTCRNLNNFKKTETPIYRISIDKKFT